MASMLRDYPTVPQLKIPSHLDLSVVISDREKHSHEPETAINNTTYTQKQLCLKPF